MVDFSSIHRIINTWVGYVDSSITWMREENSCVTRITTNTKFTITPKNMESYNIK